MSQGKKFIPPIALKPSLGLVFIDPESSFSVQDALPWTALQFPSIEIQYRAWSKSPESLYSWRILLGHETNLCIGESHANIQLLYTHLLYALLHLTNDKYRPPGLDYAVPLGIAAMYYYCVAVGLVWLLSNQCHLMLSHETFKQNFPITAPFHSYSVLI